ncbi:MAG: hypothetical protein JXA42_08015 [Anaerolineales bacterium]|nr:hypothetical protein [Anaerolineales bacterium]
MAKQIYDVLPSPVLSIMECQGTLSIQGWSKQAARIQCDDENIQVSQEGSTIMVTSQSDLRIDVPYDTRIQAQSVQGDATIKRISGQVTLEQIQGDLVVNRTGHVELGEIQGDLSAKHVDGDLTAGQIQGDMNVRGVNGNLTVKQVGRDLGLRSISGSVTAKDVQGDIRLRIELNPSCEYYLKAGGDIVARLPLNSNADLTLRSGRGAPRVKARLADVTQKENEVAGRLGDGGAEVWMESGRDLLLTVKETSDESSWSEFGAELGSMGAELGLEFAGLAEDIADQIEQQMSEMSAQLEEKLIAVAALDVRAAKAAEEVQRQAEKAADRLRRAAERQAEKARRKATQARWEQNRPRGSREREPEVKPASEPVTDDERLAILNMVAEGKITVEEAETLLEALQS